MMVPCAEMTSSVISDVKPIIYNFLHLYFYHFTPIHFTVTVALSRANKISGKLATCSLPAHDKVAVS